MKFKVVSDTRTEVHQKLPEACNYRATSSAHAIQHNIDPSPASLRSKSWSVVHGCGYHGTSPLEVIHLIIILHN